eukprot:896519-Pelagomonas_calceolata.AAC.7
MDSISRDPMPAQKAHEGNSALAITPASKCAHQARGQDTKRDDICLPDPPRSRHHEGSKVCAEFCMSAVRPDAHNSGQNTPVLDVAECSG